MGLGGLVQEQQVLLECASVLAAWRWMCPAAGLRPVAGPMACKVALKHKNTQGESSAQHGGGAQIQCNNYTSCIKVSNYKLNGT